MCRERSPAKDFPRGSASARQPRMSLSPANTHNWGPKCCSRVQLGERKRQKKKERCSKPRSLRCAAWQLPAIRKTHLGSSKGLIPASPQKPTLLKIKRRNGVTRTVCRTDLSPVQLSTCTRRRPEQQGGAGGREPRWEPQPRGPFPGSQPSGNFSLFPPQPGSHRLAEARPRGSPRVGTRSPRHAWGDTRETAVDRARGVLKWRWMGATLRPQGREGSVWVWVSRPRARRAARNAWGPQRPPQPRRQEG